MGSNEAWQRILDTLAPADHPHGSEQQSEEEEEAQPESAVDDGWRLPRPCAAAREARRRVLHHRRLRQRRELARTLMRAGTVELEAAAERRAREVLARAADAARQAVREQEQRRQGERPKASASAEALARLHQLEQELLTSDRRLEVLEHACRETHQRHADARRLAAEFEIDELQHERQRQRQRR